MRRSLILVIVLTGLISGQSVSSEGETLVYAAGFRLFSAGTATMELTDPSPEDPDNSLRIISRTETDPLFDHIYRIRDRIELRIRPETWELEYMFRDIQEGHYTLQDSAIVDRGAGLIYTQKDTLAVEGPIYDPVGAIYYLRSLPLEVGDEITLNIFNGRRMREIIIRVTGKEQIRVPAGEFECLVLRPAAADNRRLTKVDGLLHIWLATDQRRTPVRVEQKTGFGTMVMKLMEAR
ncbi:MAG: DUF3108 domain-containing protein [Fidelibacterota bacterium]|nr:MAG: DUF3108 domain-containing protein [Candidatus Neomarinimicrobiota bacterium]